ncbi:MAG: hypothetical protein IPH62_04115 [Ignavibacteriae bacterium]|nr:hypothetical protein [Ignavibacteriota bacterium]
MNISTNSVGNYKPVNNIANKNVSNIQNAKNESVNDITKEEKKYFTKLYPNEKNTINDYQFYNKDGDKKTVLVGSLFDKRG